MRDAFSGLGIRGDIEHPVGQQRLGDAGDLAARIGDHLAAATLPYLRGLRRVIFGIRAASLMDRWRPMAIRDIPYHWPRVSALYLLHDHGS